MVSLSREVFKDLAPELRYVTGPGLELQAPQQDDDWSQIESEAATIIESDNTNFWRKGELALRVERRYGESGIKKLSAACKLGAPKTLYEHAQLAEFFVPSARAKVPSLKKEYFKQALRAVKGATQPIQNPLDAVMTFLEKAEDDDKVSAAALGREMRSQFGQVVKMRWHYQPNECHTIGEYCAMLMPADLIQKIHDEVLVHAQEPDFRISVSFSVTLQPKGK